MNMPTFRRQLATMASSLLATGVCQAGGAQPLERPLPEVIHEALAVSAAQYDWMLTHQPLNGKVPRTFEHDALVTALTKDWTVGFFPGSLWFLYEATGDAKWRTAAAAFTALLEPQQFNRSTHDVGFILNCSFGNGYRLTGEPAYRQVLLNGAESLGSRFNPAVGCIKSWDRDPAVFTCPVIIDNMMNLELLLWAARNGGDPRLRTMAIAHADTTLRNHYRPDNSCFHVVDYDPITGLVRRRVTHQGAGDESAWSRGQAWGLYGYTVLFRETRDPRYLAQAEKIATFLIHHPRLPADKVPYWDFDAPDIPHAPRDSSAAAVMCSALFELRRYVAPPAAAEYTAFAAQQLRSLASPAYLAQPGENGGFLLKHATGNHPKNSEVDVPLDYADYYFLEALLRAREIN
jgi:unsaturated chondroitin disaccharide hydrolase